MGLPETTKDITANWLNNALHENGVLGNANIVSLKNEQIGIGHGLLSEIARLTPLYDRDDARLPITVIAKLPSSQESLRNLASRTLKNEIWFYTQIGMKSPIRTPSIFFAQSDEENRRHMLLMEDCSRYSEADPDLYGFTFETAKMIALKMADFHARWWNDKYLFSLPSLPSVKRTLFSGNPLVSWDACNKLDDFRATLPDEGWEAARKISEKHLQLLETIPEDNLTFNHVDLRGDNMFFDRNTPDDSFILFDWGLAGVARGVYDISYLLGLSLETRLRRRVEKDIITAYYERLLLNGVTGYTSDECWVDYLRGLLIFSRIPLVTFYRADRNNARAFKWTHVSLRRCFSAIIDNDATCLLP